MIMIKFTMKKTIFMIMIRMFFHFGCFFVTQSRRNDLSDFDEI